MTELQILIDNCDQHIADCKQMIKDNEDVKIIKLISIMGLIEFISKTLYISIQGNLDKEKIILPLFNKLKEVQTQQLEYILQMIHEDAIGEQTYIDVSNDVMEKLNAINNLINLYYGTNS